uniref:BTB domain-containing protein n=1 Tax=Plectus sambesii TaxID=2011161 RepID=A0A914VV87_9BILA
MSVKQLLASRKTCTARCRSAVHCDEALTALSRAESLQQAQAYLLLTCRNFWHLNDDRHRSLVHWAAARGKIELLAWLLDEFAADFSHKDTESHYTPLHLAFLHGEIGAAQKLINRGAGLLSIDNEGLTPIELIHKDQNTLKCLSDSALTEVYTCGENLSYNLGHKLMTHRVMPEPIDYFRRRSLSVKKVSMSKFHTLFLASDGHVFACGHGLGGRLGVGDEQYRSWPEGVAPHRLFVDIAAAALHSVFVDVDGSAFTCGQNDHGCLSVGEGIDKLLEPTMVALKDSPMFVGCAAGARHTVLWTKSGTVLTCGQNTHGQLGHTSQPDVIVSTLKKIPRTGLNAATTSTAVDVGLLSASPNRYASSPNDGGGGKSKKRGGKQRLYSSGEDAYASPTVDFSRCGAMLPNESESTQRIAVAVSDQSTLIALENGDIRLFTDFDCKVIGRKRLDWRHVAVADDPLLVTMVSNSGRVFVWDGSGEFRTASYVGASVPTAVAFRHAAQFRNGGIVLLSEDGIAYRGQISTKPARPDSSDYKAVSVSTRIGNVHRALSVAVTSDGKNSAFIQRHPAADLAEAPMVSSGELGEDMKRLLEEASSEDGVSDVIVRAGAVDFPAHRFVLFSRSTKIRTAVESEMVDGRWELPVHHYVARQFLLYLYSDWCDLLTVGHRWKPENGVKADQNENDLESIAVVANGNSKQQKKKGQAKQAPTKKTPSGLDPIAALADLAKRFAVKSLLAQLQTVQWRDGQVYSVPHQRPAPPRPRFDMTRCGDLRDADIVCSDGETLQAHRCMLCGRLEFFRSMLMSSWMEATGSVLRFPVASDVGELIIRYLYADELPEDFTGEGEVADAPSDVLCRLMVAADQLLIDRLREICEAKLAASISLRNVHELLQFAETYNADQLKTSCVHFIALNLPSLVDANMLSFLDDACLYAIGEQYRRLFPAVACRRLTPRMAGEPTLEELRMTEAEVMSSGCDIADLTGALLEEHAAEIVVLKKAAPARKQKTSVGPGSEATLELAHLSISPTEKTNNALVGDENVSPANVSRASVSPMDVSHASVSPIEVSPNPNGSPEIASPSEWLPTPPISAKKAKPKFRPWSVAPASPAETFPDFAATMKAEQELAAKAAASGNGFSADPLGNYFARRRSQAPDTNANIQAQRSVAQWSTLSPTSSPDNASFVSLKDVMAAEELTTRGQSMTSRRAAVLAAPQRTKKTSWSMPDSQPTAVDLASIQKDEQGREVARRRQTSKPLDVIQLEERAMEELLWAYGAHANFDELITVERAEHAELALPVWRAHQ